MERDVTWPWDEILNASRHLIPASILRTWGFLCSAAKGTRDCLILSRTVFLDTPGTDV